MAASGNVPEQGRPPEALRKYGVDRKSPSKGSEGGGATYRNNNDVNDNEMTDVNYNVDRRRLLKEEAKIGSCKETLRKVFFKKIKSEEEIKTVSGSLETSRKARNSFLHQDVEEALNSLLWQPYEYQKTSMSSLSSCGSLESSSNNTESSGNVADLHLLVNNLRVNRLSQSRAAHRSRDPAERRSETYLPIAASRLEQLKGAASCYASLSRYNVHCDEYPYKAGDMRVEIQPVLTRSENTVCVSTPSQNRNVAHPGTTRNLSSVNVVGLPPPNVVPTRVPHHSRNTSEPYTSLPINHPRNGSEPLVTTYNRVVQIQQRYPVSHLRSSSVPYQQQPQQQNVNVAQNARSKVPLNVSNVNVNYYRAVPVNVVSAVPTIQCTNTDSNNVSNVNIMPVGANTTTTTSTEVVVHSTPAPEIRTFTSTEAQTDDPQDCTREQRRRERRERRHQRRLNNHRHNAAAENTTSTQTERLPDLVPPPYSTMPSNQTVPPVPAVPPPPPVVPMVPPPGTIVQSMVPNNIVPSGLIANGMVPFHPPVVPGQVPLVQGAGAVSVPVPSPTGFRFPFPAGGFRRSRYSEEPPKSCCGLLAWRPGSLRWFIALIALVAVCCVLVGTALGAMRPSGRDHLTVSLLMIGVGIILVTVSGVAWRLTSHDSSTCRSMLGLGSTESVEVCPRRFVPRLPPSYGRPHHPYAAMMYPEFQYRPPPPSYQASMQEYRLRLLLLDRGNTPQIQAGIQNAVSPPPTYRSHSGSLLRAPLSNRRDLSQSEYSCPPSYRSQTSSRPTTLLPSSAIIHSREHSLSISESNNESVVNVVNILSTNEEEIALDNITLDSLKLEPDNDINPLRMLLKGGSGDLEGSKDGNLVTIVQTSDQSPVIVTVSGSSHDNCNTVQITELPSEMEILAHL